MSLRSPGPAPSRPSPAAPEQRTAPAARLGWRLAAAAVALVVLSSLAAAAGWWVRGAAEGDPPPAPPPLRAVTVGPVTLATPADWTPVPSGEAKVPGLAPAAAKVFAPTPGLRAHVVLGVSRIDHPTLLPEPLRALLPRQVPEPSRTKLLGVPAWRYDGRATADGRVVEITTVPSTAGALSVACIATESAWVGAQGCASGLRALQLERGESWQPPAADIAARARLPRLVERLDARRVAIRPRLRRATTRRGQSMLARRLARAYSRAAGRLAPLAPPSGPTARALRSMRGSADAYRRLGAAATENRPRGYRRARRAVARHEARLVKALAG